MRARAAKAGRDGPGRAEYRKGDRGLRDRSSRSAHAQEILAVPADERQQRALCSKVLANDSVEQAIVGPLSLQHLDMGHAGQFRLVHVPIRELDDRALEQLSRPGQLYLTLVEMQTIQQYYRQLERDPTDVELESLAQTWSEHCSHKTLAGRIAYRDEQGERRFNNMLKETIFAATQQIRRELGADDWCVSVFEDNAGVVRFDDAVQRGLQGRNAQPSFGPGAVRRRQHRASAA